MNSNQPERLARTTAWAEWAVWAQIARVAADRGLRLEIAPDGPSDWSGWLRLVELSRQPHEVDES